jgi:hypothetical protein
MTSEGKMERKTSLDFFDLNSLLLNGPKHNHDYISRHPDHWLSTYAKIWGSLGTETSCEITAQMLQEKLHGDVQWEHIDKLEFQHRQSSAYQVLISTEVDFDDAECGVDHVFTVCGDLVLQSFFCQHTLSSSLMTKELANLIERGKMSDGDYKIVDPRALVYSRGCRDNLFISYLVPIISPRFE